MSALGVALRIARRDALCNRWRSVLVVALIGLPVLLLTVADVAWRTYQLSPSQKLDREIGKADLAVQDGGAGNSVVQAPGAWLDSNGGYTADGSGDRAARTSADLLAVLPRGSRVIERVYGPDLDIRTEAGIAYGQLVGLDYRDPLGSALVHQVSGRAPGAPDEVVLTTRLAESTGLGPGDTLRTTAGSYRIVGTVLTSARRNDRLVFGLPAAAKGNPDRGYSVSWLVDTPAPFTWQQVLGLNAKGYVALSRKVVLDPPPRSEVPFYQQNLDNPSRINPQVVGATSLIAGMALLEVVLLAGPAFAVGAKRQRRDLALVAVAGGTRSSLRTIVLANGIVLGLAAGAAGVALGIVATAIGIPLIHLDQIPGPYDVRLLDLGGLFAVALGTAVLAAIMPARAAARTDVLAALAGRRGEPRIRRRVPILGALVVGAGIAVALAGTGFGSNVNLILGGVALTELGLIICTPTLITGAAALGRRLPLGPRLALRDAARNRSSAAPAIAAIMAATIGAVAIAIVATSQIDLDRRQYTPKLPAHVAQVQLFGGNGPLSATDRASVAEALRRNLDVRGVYPVSSIGGKECDANQRDCTAISVQTYDPASGDLSYTRAKGSTFGEVVDDGTAVGALFGVDLPDAEAALRAGKAVVPDAQLVRDGRITLWRITEHFAIDDNGNPVEPTERPKPERLEVPAVAVSNGFPAAWLIVPPSMARTLWRAEPEVTSLIAPLNHDPSDKQRQAVNAALVDIDPDLRVETEDGYHSDLVWALYGLVGAAGLIALGAAAAATALANTDGRPDLVTLGAVGASPRTRRTLTMSRAGVIGVLGCLVGAAAGFLPAVAWIKRQAAQYASWGNPPGSPTLHLVVPWHLIAIAALGVPAVAVVVTGLFSRARLPSERPAD